jgi:hypothetical protein
MASIISAGTSSGTALNMTGDTSGNLVFQTGAGANTITVPNATGTVALTSEVIGIGQTWQNVAGSRVAGTTYTNSTGKPITIAISYTVSALNTVQGLTISGVSVFAAGYPAANGGGSGFALIVPNGATYATLTNSGTITIVSWVELR